MFAFIPFVVGLQRPLKYAVTKCTYCPQTFDRLSTKMAHENTCFVRGIMERQVRQTLEDLEMRHVVGRLVREG